MNVAMHQIGAPYEKRDWLTTPPRKSAASLDDIPDMRLALAGGPLPKER